MVPEDSLWCSECGRINGVIYGIRVVFDDKLLTEKLLEVNDRSLEIGLLEEILLQLNRITPDHSFMQSIQKDLASQKNQLPRFKMFSKRKEASFPDFIDSYVPGPTHFKKARKEIAEIAKKLDFSKGTYTLEDAKNKLNDLRAEIVQIINSTVSDYDYKQNIPFLLTRIDALEHDHGGISETLKYSVRHEVNYNREERYAKDESEFIRSSRNYRYLLEKFVQLQPQGKKILNKYDFQYLVALIDWLHTFYSASDFLYYGINPVGMKVSQDFLVEVAYENDMAQKEKQFAEEKANRDLGLLGSPKDRVHSSRPHTEFLAELDQSFLRDIGFTFSSLINVLQIMTLWTAYKDSVKESPYYFASTEEIEEVCLKNINGIDEKEIQPILDFLSLKTEALLRVGEKVELCEDLPVWEHRKRFARYTIRPLIKIDNKYYWGPYSARRAGVLWSGNLSYGTLPIDLNSPSIQSTLDKEKKLIEDALVDKAEEILKKFTSLVAKECRLHKIDKKAGYPQELGDYDVLGYHQEKNVVFNIECKDILPVFCLKDAKRLREKIYGKEGKNDGHLKQIKRRQGYLAENIVKVAKTLNWPIDTESLPKIETIYLTRIAYWWTRFPPEDVNIIFLQIDMISNFIENI